MANKDFNLTLKMRAEFAQAQAALKGAQGNIGKIGSELDRVNKLGATARGVFVGVGVAAVAMATVGVAVMSKYIANTIEAEKVQAQLASRIRDTAGAAGRSLAQLNAEADRLSKKTIFDDEAVGEVQDMLLTFREIKDVRFDQSVDSVLDLATVMRTDGRAAAIMLGKALNDPVRGMAALRKAGIGFTPEQELVIKQMVKTGDVAGAQAIILDELANQMGTASEAARDTLGGALQALSNSFDNLLEGDVADGGLRGARDAVEALNDTLNDPATKEGFDNLITGALTALGALAKFAAGTANVAKFIGEEIASRVHGPAADDAVRIDRELEIQQLNYDSVVRNLGADDRQAMVIAKRIAGLKAMKQATEDAAVEALRLANIKPPAVDTTLSDPAAIAAARAAAEAAAAAKKAGKGKKATDPDDAIKRRLEGLREEIALLDTLEKGETKASDAAKLRYDIDSGELAKSSPALKQQVLDLQAVADKKNAAIKAAEKNRELLKETTEAYEDLREELRTPAEIALDDAIAKVDALNAAFKESLASKAEYDESAGRIAGGLVDKSPEFNGPSPELGGAMGEFDRLDQAAEKEDQWYQDSLARLAQFRSQRADQAAAADAAELALEAQHKKNMDQIDRARQHVALNAAGEFFGQLATLQNSENSKMAAIGKAAAIAQALINTYQGATAAYTSMASIPVIGPALGIAAAAAAIAAGLANVAQIRAQPTGFAEGGYTGAGGKWDPAGIVHAEEFVARRQVVRQPGARDFLEQFNQVGMKALYGWTGYAEGGLVTPAAPRLPSPNWDGFPQGGLDLPTPKVNVRISNFNDLDTLSQQIGETSQFERNVINVINNNPKSFGQ